MLHRYILPLAIAISTAAVAGPPIQPAAGPAVTARILELINQQTPPMDDPPTFHGGRGFRLTLGLSIPDATIIGIHGKITLLQDDRGDDLLKAVSDDERKIDDEFPGFIDSPVISHDRRTVGLAVETEPLPPHVKSLRIKGDFVLVVGLKKVDQPPVAVQFAKDATFDADGAKFTVDADQGNQNPLTSSSNNYFIDLETHQPVPKLVGFYFTDDQGSYIDAPKGMAAWDTRTGHYSLMQQYSFAKPLTHGRVVPTVWTQTEDRPISVDLQVGMGLKPRSQP